MPYHIQAAHKGMTLLSAVCPPHPTYLLRRWRALACQVVQLTWHERVTQTA